jgi:hypothetical protein
MIRTAIFSLLLLLLVTGSASADDVAKGEISLGYTFLDQEGNRSVNRGTRNLYEGVTLSLEDFRYYLGHDLRLFANLYNVTLENRNLIAGVSKPGHGALTLRHQQYRRIYDFDGDLATDRLNTSGNLWWRPVKQVKLFGGYGVTDRSGHMVSLLDTLAVDPTHPIDYRHTFTHAGLTLRHKQHSLSGQVRLSAYEDELESDHDRNTRRWRLTAGAPLPRWDFVVLNAGFERYMAIREDRDDSLIANTVWGGARAYPGKGYNIRYSFVFDRSRRTGDLSATDNIINVITGGRTWRDRVGFEAGYHYELTDDVLDERTGQGVTLTAWYRPVDRLTIRVGYGADHDDFENNHNLTGRREHARHHARVRYRIPAGSIRLSYQSKLTEYEDLGSEADYRRYSADAYLESDRYGRAQADLSYADGDYANTDGDFAFREYLAAGELESPAYRGLRVGFGGTYMRTKRDLDVESFVVRMFFSYQFMPDYSLNGEYSAHNFDDFDDTAGIYTQYYTANVVQLSLSRTF